jgi:hypothetical protein
MSAYKTTAILAYVLGGLTAPTWAESPSALNGVLYAVISNTYAGAGGSLSYIRLFNAAATKNKFNITVVGSPSGRTYGTTDIEVNPLASPQYSLTQILTLAGVGGLNDGDTNYSLYLQNPEHLTGYQHIVFNSNTRFFENISACSSLLSQHQIPESLSLGLPNVHTSRLADYPSQVLIHNYWDLPIIYRVSVIDAVTGGVIGTVDIATAANASYTFPFSFFEERLGWVPTASQFHANLIFKQVGDGFPPVNVGQSIRNQALGADINMGLVCSVNLATSLDHKHDD